MAMARASSGLAYPDRFYAASAYAGFGGSPNSSSKGVTSKFSNDVALLLYALYQQATVGPCNIPKPRGWSPVEQSKWTSEDEQIKLLQAQILSFEDTCRAQAQGEKRRHDDHEGPDGHEGEKRRRLVESTTAATVSEAQPTETTQPGSTPTYVDSQVESEEPSGQVSTEAVMQIPEGSMDVGPTVEKPLDGDTETLGNEEVTEDWKLINLDATTDTTT